MRSTLRLRARDLASRGVDVPAGDAECHSWLFSDPSADGAPSPGAALVSSLYPADTDWVAMGRVEAARVAGSRGTVLVLSEFLHLLRDPRAALAALGDPARAVVCCARDQVEVATSLVAELVKEPDLSLDDAAALALRFSLDHDGFEDLWRSSGFHVSFVPYTGDVVRGVLSAMSLGDFADGAERENVGVPREAVAYLYSRKAELSRDPAWAGACEAFCAAARDLHARFADRPLLPLGAAAMARDRWARSNALTVARHPHLADALTPRSAAAPYAGMGARTRVLCDRLLAAALVRVSDPASCAPWG